MCKTPSARNDVSAPAAGVVLRPVLASRAMDAAPRSAVPRGRSAEAGLLVAIGALLAAAVFHGGGSRVDSLASGRYRGARRRRDRARVRAQRRAAPPSPRPDGADRDPRRRRADRLGRDLDRLVDRRRSLVGLARPEPRLPRVPRSRAPRGSAVRRGAGASPRSSRSSSRPRSAGRSSALRSPRCSRTAIASRASASRPATGTRSRCWRTARSPRPLARERASTGAPRRRGAARVRRGARDAAHPVTAGGRRRRRGRRPLARAEPGAAGGRPAPGRLRRPGARGRRLGLHPTRARRRRRAARRPGLRRPGLRRADPGHGTRGRARGLEAPDRRSSPSANGS